MADFQVESYPVARKHHKCGECNGLINPGQKYQRIAGSWEGSMDSFTTCSECVGARDWATSQPEWADGDEYLFSFGRLEEDLADLAPEIRVGDGRRFHALRLQVQMRRRNYATLNSRKAA
ncbi:hypothetical protein [Pseudomonas sp. S9]|uniref:hypothetical protein n=1 Tax=Pseudomonas sp. S9 TaxID=686578 RepID=UPI0002556DBF|nr:hypothetical protein [Pseudomonas sp. S9]